MSLAREVTRERQSVLGAVLIALLALSVLVLFEVLGTIVFALTMAYLLGPMKRRLRRRGVGQLTATLIVTVGAVAGVLALLTPIVIVLVLRLDEAIQLVVQLPATITVSVAGFEQEFALVEPRRSIEGWVRALAVDLTARIPVLLVKLSLFAFLVFALVYNERDIADNVLSVVPPRHRDIGRALHRRASNTLYAIYVLQGATAVATLFIAMPVFYLFGYDSWLALAAVAGVLQFVPVIGPSVLIAALAIGEALLGDAVGAVTILLVAGLLIGALPDVVVRPRLASYTIRLPSTMYFIGFVGGMLTVGALGIIVGPLVIALLTEAAGLLAAGFESDPETTPADPDESAG